MKTITFFFAVLLINSLIVLDIGVGIIYSGNLILQKFVSSDVAVNVKNKVVIITISQIFKNDFGSVTKFKFT